MAQAAGNDYFTVKIIHKVKDEIELNVRPDKTGSELSATYEYFWQLEPGYASLHYRNVKIEGDRTLTSYGIRQGS